MNERNYYIDCWMRRLAPEAQQTLKRYVAAIDYALFDALEQREAVTARGEYSPIGAIDTSEIAARKAEFTAIGLEAIRAGQVGAVLLAGGQGTRLGSSLPKGMVNIGITQELFIFECLMNNLQEVTKQAGAWVPLYIMTSADNHEAIIAFFEEHSYFGYPSDQVEFFVQEMVPAVDFRGRILMKSETEPVLSPNGNGGWFSSMAKAGILEEIRAKGIQWLNVFGADNVLQRIADPAFVGATICSGCDCGTKVVRKTEPGEHVGVLCRENGKPSVIEYYDMSEDMAQLRNPDGTLVYGFGVILNYLFSESKLEQIMNAHMPIHVVEKKIPYLDEDGHLISPAEPNGYKFETLALDMVHMMDDCLAYEVIRENEFAPIKNLHGVDSVDSARELLQRNGVIL